MSTDGIARLSMLAQTAVLTSQGVPFLLSGEEIMRDKKGVHNSYCSPDSINRLDWANKERHSDVFEYYKKLIALRKNHPAFRLGDADKVRKHLEFLKPAADCVVAFRLKDYAGGDSWKNIIVILNGNTEAKEVKIPKGTYTIVCRDGKISEEGMGILTGNTVISAPQSAMIIHN
jgi:pullulanase